MKIVKNDLFDYKNRYIYQDEDGFKFSLDSILLAEFVDQKTKGDILDLCTGNAAIPLILSTKMNNKMYGFEIQESVCKLAVDSIKLNNLDNQITVYNDNFNNALNYFKCESLNTIVCNPPFFKVNESSYINENELLSIARHEIEMELNDIFEISFKLLKSGGILYIVQRANRLDELIESSIKNRVRVKEIQFIKTKEDKNPEIVLLKCVKNAKESVKIKKEICVDNLSTYQQLFKEG